jgi:predicted AAA+ superfamily ATPase
MHGYIERAITPNILAFLTMFPAVALIGPRQCGKSRLAAKIAESFPGAISSPRLGFSSLGEPEL